MNNKPPKRFKIVQKRRSEKVEHKAGCSMLIVIEGVYDMEWLGKGKGKGNQCRTPESGESFFPYRDLETAKLGKEEPGDRSERTLGKTCRPMLDLDGIIR